MGTAEQWLGKCASLKVDKARGDPAPHKPLLLLVVLELAEQGKLPSEVLPLTPELAFQFCTYWSVVAHRRSQRPDVRYPFFHLKSDGFWSPLEKTASRPRSASRPGMLPCRRISSPLPPTRHFATRRAGS